MKTFHQLGKKKKKKRNSDVRSPVNPKKANAKKTTPMHIIGKLPENPSWEESPEGG